MLPNDEHELPFMCQAIPYLKGSFHDFLTSGKVLCWPENLISRNSFVIKTDGNNMKKLWLAVVSSVCCVLPLETCEVTDSRSKNSPWILHWHPLNVSTFPPTFSHQSRFKLPKDHIRKRQHLITTAFRSGGSRAAFPGIPSERVWCSVRSGPLRTF